MDESEQVFRSLEKLFGSHGVCKDPVLKQISIEKYKRLKEDFEFYIDNLRKIMSLDYQDRQREMRISRSQGRKASDRLIKTIPDILNLKSYPTERGDLDFLGLPSKERLESRLNQLTWARKQYGWRSGPNAERNLELLFIANKMREESYIQSEILCFFFLLFYEYDFDGCRERIDEEAELPEDITNRLRDVLNRGYP